MYLFIFITGLDLTLQMCYRELSNSVNIITLMIMSVPGFTDIQGGG